MKNRLLIAVFCAIALFSCTKKQDTYTVIVSLDGFRWDYPQMYSMPFMDSLASVGVKARMQPSYPSSTFPNHYTLITGLVPDHHGLVNNKFWVPEFNHGYSLSDSESRYDPAYYGGETIWATAQKQGVKTASVYWVGSDIPIGGTLPTYFRNWDEQPHWTFPERVDEAVRLMSLPEDERPRLATVYFDEPDHQGHVYGPYSKEVADAAHKMDSLVHSLYLRLKALPIGDRLNFIVTGDHGMTELSPERFINSADYIPEEWVDRVIGSNPTSIWVKEEFADTLTSILSGVEHVRVWRHGNVPEYLNYGTSSRLGEIIVAPDTGWQFDTKPASKNGAHGFDCTHPDMMVAFRAVGPAFKESYEAPFTKGEESAFHNTDIYPLLCRLLGVKPAQTDGDIKRIDKILK